MNKKQKKKAKKVRIILEIIHFLICIFLIYMEGIFNIQLNYATGFIIGYWMCGFYLIKNNIEKRKEGKPKEKKWWGGKPEDRDWCLYCYYCNNTPHICSKSRCNLNMDDTWYCLEHNYYYLRPRK